MSSFKVLMFGDIVGKPGRRAIQEKLPELKKKYKPDLTIANVENLTHGFGVNEKHLNEMLDAGIDFFTSGNHIFKREKNLDKLFADFPLIRPANYPQKKSGNGYKIIEVGIHKVLIANLMGEAFFEEKTNNFLKTIDKILQDNEANDCKIKILDFHAEATSEKKIISIYLDGKFSLVAGTHTHIQTADEQILPNGTGYITDLGMTGLKYSSLGIEAAGMIKSYKTGVNQPKKIPEHGLCTINGIFAKINTQTGLTEQIKKFDEEVEI